MRKKIELLAPAKNIEIGIAAINCGADALYIAGPDFGARESAGNPIHEIEQLIQYAHKFGVKVYLVINTILYDNEIDKAQRLINKAYEIGIDALIIQDLGILKMELPHVPLYASTQTNIRTPEQAVFLESLGFKRLILARELSLEQIGEIRKSVNCELETFIHGALCVSYSGQCYLSQKIIGRSANRGACIQACRSLWNLEDSTGKILVRNKPLLSLKDLCYAPHIEELIRDGGVTSFKIEGRLKNISYVKNITRLYRSLLDDFMAKNPEFASASLGKIEGGFKADPSATFNRGYTDLFFSGKRAKWSSDESTKSIGEYIGIISLIERPRQRGILTFKIEKTRSPLHNGDGIIIINPSGDNIGTRLDKVENGLHFIKYTPLLAKGMKVYRNYNIAFEKELENNMPKRLVDVDLNFKYSDQDNASIDAELNYPGSTIRCSYTIPYAPPIANNPVTAERSIFEALNKTSDIYQFHLRTCEASPVPFFTIAQLNEARRELAKKLNILIAEQFTAGKQSENSQQVHPHYPAADIIDTAGLADITYLANCSNSLSESLYRDLGAQNIQPAYEIAPVDNAELMRTKLCIKYELGLCPKHHKSKQAFNPKEPLFIINGNNKFRLKFDCIKCEMIIHQI